MEDVNAINGSFSDSVITLLLILCKVIIENAADLQLY